MLTYEEIMKNTRWIIKFDDRPRVACESTEEMHWYRDNYADSIRDIDLACTQPDCVKDFYDAYWKYDEEHGFTIIKDFYENVYSKNNE